MERQFCYLCGSKLTQTSDHAWECQVCHQSCFRNGQAATGVIIVNDKNEVLVTVRAREPAKGLLDVPGGFVEPKESLEAAAYRELAEETGITAADITPLRYITSGSNTYKWGKDTVYATDAIFTAVLLHEVKLVSADDVASLEWVALQQVEPQSLFVPAAGEAVKLLQHDIDKKA